MATTPEAKTKRRIHRLLELAGAYAVNYIGGQYANNGTPDILVCLQGRFLAVEAKSLRGKPTALQLTALAAIDTAGGVALVINDDNIGDLTDAITAITEGRPARSNYLVFGRKDQTDDLNAGSTPTLRRAKAAPPRRETKPDMGNP